MSRGKGRTCSTANSLPLSTNAYDLFLADIQKLSRHNRQNHVPQIPHLFGHPINLQKLYNEIAIRGGHKEVTYNHLWTEVYCALSLPSGCINAGHGLRSIYQRYLEPYERSQRSFIKSLMDKPDGSSSSSILWDLDYADVELYKPTKSVPFVEEIPNHLRETSNLSLDLIDKVDHVLLERSLSSGLSNEIELTLNTLLLMSSQPNFVSFYANPKLLDLLLHSVDICNLVHKAQSSFQLLDNQDMIYGDKEAFRVHLVATIIRNLAVDDRLSALTIGRHRQALRFIFLCIYANHTTLHQIGLEILSSLHIPVIGPLVSIFKSLLPNLLSSSDRLDRIRGLQFIKNLCTTPLLHDFSTNHMDKFNNGVSLKSNNQNSEFLATLPSPIFASIASALCLRDLHIAVLAVDVVYCLALLGPSLCHRLHHCSSQTVDPYPSVLPLLMTMLNVEAQAMGSESLIRVRVMQATGTGSAVNVKPITAKPTTCIQSGDATSFVVNSMNTSKLLTYGSKQEYDRLVLRNCQTAVNYVPILAKTSVTSTTSELTNSNVIFSKPTYDKLTSVVRPNDQATCCTFSSTITASTTLSTSDSSKNSKGPAKRDLLIRSCSPVPTTTQIHQTMRSIQQNSTTSLVNSTKLIKSVAVSTTSSSAILSPPNSCNSSSGSSKNELHVGHLTHPNLNEQLCQLNSTNHAAIKKTASNDCHSVNTKQNDSLMKNDQLDRWEFMFEWLKSTYTVHSHFSIPRIQMYSDYQKAHQQTFGNVGVVSPIDFHSQIKTIFPGVGQVKVQVPGGSVEVHYNNLKHIDAPETDTQAGVNCIMASVLSPTAMEANSSANKSRIRKRPLINNVSPKPSKPDDTVTQTKMAKYNLHETNGHSEHKLTNGQLIQAINGVSKDATNIANKSIPNGFKVAKHVDSSIQQESTNFAAHSSLVLTESRIVILPVFTPMISMNGKLNGEHTTLVSCLSNNKLLMPSPKTNIDPPSENGGPNTTSIASRTPLSSTTTTTAKTSVNSIAELLMTNKLPLIFPADEDDLFVNNFLFCQWDYCREMCSDLAELWSHFKQVHAESVRTRQSNVCLWGEKCSCDISNLSVESLRKHLENDHFLALKDLSGTQLDVVVSTEKQSSMHSVENDVSDISQHSRSIHEIEKPLIYSASQTLSEESLRALAGGTSNPSFILPVVHEGPVTKHLRLTSALALKNMLKYNESARRYVSTWKSFLCDLVFANLDSSPTLMECISLLTDVPSSIDPTIFLELEE